MSVQKIKSDMNLMCNTVSGTIIEIERCKSVIDSLGIINENDLSRIIQNCKNCIDKVNRFERSAKTVHNECSVELNIFFRDYNRFMKQFLTHCKVVVSALKEEIIIAKSCYEFYQISDEIEWILMCGITPDLFNGIIPTLYSFKNELQNVQLKTFTNNNKLIVKVR